MDAIIISTLPLFLIMLLGSIIKKQWISSDEFWRGLEKLLYFVLFPSMMFNSIANADLSSVGTKKLITALIIANVITSIIIIIYQTRSKGDKIQFTSIFQGAIRYNSYTFFGMSNTLFDAEGIAIVAVVASYMIGCTNILSVCVFAAFLPDNSKNSSNSRFQRFFILSLKLIFTNPLIIASLLGFIVNYSDTTLNLSVQKTIIALGNGALAIAMLNIGAGLQFDSCKQYYRQIATTSFFKLILLPIISFTVLIMSGVSGEMRTIGILYSCLPCASSAYVLSRQLGGDATLMAALISFTTILSIISMPIIMYVFG